MVEQEPQLEARIAHGDFHPGLARGAQGPECPRQVLVAKIMIGVEEHPELVADLHLFLLFDLLKGRLQTIHDMHWGGKPRIFGRGQDDDLDPHQTRCWKYCSGA